MTKDLLATKVQNQLQTSEGLETLRTDLGSLDQKYVETVLKRQYGWFESEEVVRECEK